MTTPETTNDLRHSFTITKGKERTSIKIRLNDECRNGHEDFSITADIDEMDGRGRWRESGGGCCHEHILSLRPDFAPFVALHLSDWQGAPMHCGANAFYWFAGFNGGLGQEYHGGSGPSGKKAEDCRAIFKNHVRASEEQMAEIVRQMPRSAQELQAILEDLNFPQQWQEEADRATAQLEIWTGKKFESKATRSQFTPLSSEARAIIEERRASGYYTPEQVAARDEQKRAARKAKRISELRADYEKNAKKLADELTVQLALVEFFPEKVNAIFYTHTRTVAFNWSNLDRLHTREEFDAFAASEHAKTLPDGVKLEWQEKPKR